MASPLSVKRNNYIDNPKPSDIYTPEWLSKWLFKLVFNSGMNWKLILDPAIGAGSLTNPFREHDCSIIGFDINPESEQYCDFWCCKKFEDITVDDFNNLGLGDYKPDLIIVNPPFNSASGRKLYPEVFLRKIHELFGNKIPVIMIVPMGMRLNQRLKSSRWKYIRDNWKINSIISLPIDIFDDVLFHAEILCFNVSGMEPCYFIPDEIIPLEKLNKANGKNSI